MSHIITQNTLPLQRSVKLKTMTVTVLFFASLREAVGQRQLELSLTEPLNVRQLADRLEAQHSGLSLTGTLCALNEHYIEPTQTLSEGDTVAFFPPVSGG